MAKCGGVSVGEGGGVVLATDIDLSWRCARVALKPHFPSTCTGICDLFRFLFGNN